jgi:hypothetical protein
MAERSSRLFVLGAHVPKYHSLLSLLHYRVTSLGFSQDIDSWIVDCEKGFTLHRQRGSLVLFVHKGARISTSSCVLGEKFSQAPYLLRMSYVFSTTNMNLREKSSSDWAVRSVLMAIELLLDYDENRKYIGIL